MSLSQRRDPKPDSLSIPPLLLPSNLQISVSLPTPALASKYIGT